ncbi:hypothetical protein J25TS5_31440 [Paenibacillus faecis]|uniref:hypothetical protein n=1 Tax=Paenibacillus faecis TaxID=862114 RepID=UPI001B0F1DAD|nr:hypothetical protein [Paenibacillus faecis]GIO86212.1 hypothetical protein J25TS5_31440 [Paenibacillus faecis]
MKRSSMLLSIALAGIAILLIALAFKMSMAPSFGEPLPHRQAWHDGMRHGQHGFAFAMKEAGRMKPETAGLAGSAAAAASAGTILLKLAVLLGGVALFAKGTGMLKWIGAGFAALCTLSLLTPLWGVIALLLAFWLYRRFGNHHLNHTSPQALIAYTSSTEASVSRGRFLDEWERNQHKKED